MGPFGWTRLRGTARARPADLDDVFAVRVLSFLCTATSATLTIVASLLAALSERAGLLDDGLARAGLRPIDARVVQRRSSE